MFMRPVFNFMHRPLQYVNKNVLLEQNVRANSCKFISCSFLSIVTALFRTRIYR